VGKEIVDVQVTRYFLKTNTCMIQIDDITAFPIYNQCYSTLHCNHWPHDIIQHHRQATLQLYRYTGPQISL